MDYRTGRIGRVIWMRLDDGDDLIECVKELAVQEKLERALVLVLGGLGRAEMVVGPREAVIPPEPIWASFTDGREILALGTLAPGPDGPNLHLHTGAGRGEEPTLIGCLKGKNQVYLLAEVVLLELADLDAYRALDRASGFNLLKFK